ncbi:MAG: acyltransferase family protein [Nibricoccus sp.]
MNTDSAPPVVTPAPTDAAVLSDAMPIEAGRIDSLDAARAFVLILGVVFHASLSFSPVFLGWAVQDVSTSGLVLGFIQISHSFRMATFFLLAGFFSQGLLQRRGLAGFLRSRGFRLGLPFVAGWFLLRPLVVSGWIMGAMSLHGDYDFWTAIRTGFQSLRSLPAGLFVGTHLWFLYYLLLVTALTLVVRTIVGLFTRDPNETGTSGGGWHRVDAAIAWLARSTWALAPLVGLTAWALWHMRRWGLDTPDQSLRLHLPVLAIYGGSFGLGWLFAREPGTIGRFGRLTLVNGVLAVLSGGAVLWLSRFQGELGQPYYFAAHLGFVIGYATLLWTLVSLTLGFFGKFFARPNAVVRYLADSSYWMYLVHLPIVVWLQVAVAEWLAPWWLKLAGISLATVALTLMTYDLFVRSTFLGALLNGRRKARILFARPGRKPASSPH